MGSLVGCAAARTAPLPAAMAEGPGNYVGDGRESEWLQKGTRVRVRVSDPRYNGREGVVLPRGGEAEGRVGVELTDWPKKLLSLRRDSLEVLSPRSSASDDASEEDEGENEVGSPSFPAQPTTSQSGCTGVRSVMFTLLPPCFSACHVLV